MNRATYLLAFFVMSLAYATETRAQEGTVTYEEVIKLDIELPPEMAHMGSELPKAQTSSKLLYFNESAALLKNADEEPAPDVNMHGDGGMVRFHMRREENESYFDFENDRQIDKRAFMGRTFLIENDEPGLSWRLSDERSEFLGYMCQKATAVEDSTHYEAWFTPEISVPAGPGEGGLPGLILVLNIDEGQRSYVAKALTLAPVEKGLIVPPKKGKKISQVEFDEIVAEKMKEMDANSSGNGFVIRMRH